MPKTAESYTYDADGNLTSDGRWTNRWDGENRLVEMTSHASGPSDSRKSLQFTYDSQSRRYSKVVSNWTGSAWSKVLDERFIYDGWNLIAAVNGTNAAIIRSFLWGLDLSGTLQGAGGVGGLICFRQHSGSEAGTHFAAFDGNGNVMALVDSGGALSARYEYDPFGQTIRASGGAAAINPVRFSSKCTDVETDFVHFGYRYLNPYTGGWLSRDPLARHSADSSYGLVRNHPIDSIDILGLIVATFGPGRETTHPDEIGAEVGFVRPTYDADYACTAIGGGYYHLEFSWVVDYVVSIVDRDALFWELEDPKFVDPNVELFWGEADLDQRIELVRSHEHRHVDDLYQSYLSIRETLLNLEGNYCTELVCDLVGTAGAAAARVEFRKAMRDTQNNRH